MNTKDKVFVMLTVSSITKTFAHHSTKDGLSQALQ